MPPGDSLNVYMEQVAEALDGDITEATKAATVGGGGFTPKGPPKFVSTASSTGDRKHPPRPKRDRSRSVHPPPRAQPARTTRSPSPSYKD